MPEGSLIFDILPSLEYYSILMTEDRLNTKGCQPNIAWRLGFYQGMTDCNVESTVF
jgi:hypothetical protein